MKKYFVKAKISAVNFEEAVKLVYKFGEIISIEQWKGKEE